MTTPSLPHAKARTEPAERSRPLRSPAPAAEDFASPVLGLQRAAGNQAVGQLLLGSLLQPKLRIGPPGDAYEREADRVADAVLRDSGAEPVAISRAHPAASLQRMCSECEEELLQKSPAGGDQTDRTDRTDQTDLLALRGAGRPLPSNLRSFFEPRFGNDFGAVRVHTGSAAGEAAQAVRARAFTVGNDVVFGAGEWSPETTAGKRLLAHELTHVVQQTPLVARRKPLLQRAPQEAGEEAPATDESAPEPESPEPAPEVAPETSPGEPASEAAAADQAPAAALIVEDDATEVGEGQMKKSDFLARLRPEVCAAAEAGLAGTEHEAEGCPLIDFLFAYYEGQSAERFNRDLPRFAGDGPLPATAEEYVALIAERVRQSVTAWARTGEITGVPQGIPLPGMGLLGGVFFKALPGGPRNPGSPQALRTELGAGRPLDGGVRSRMESAFGRSFSHVRVHADGRSAGLSHRLNARAFTVGEHVAFGSQQYQPGTVLGDALLAHELAHVAQQDGAADAVQPMRADTASYGALERDADRAAVGAVASLWGLRLPGLRRPLQAAPRLSSGLRLQRCGGCAGKKAAATTPAAAGPLNKPIPEKLDVLQAESPFKGYDTLGYTTLAPTSKHDCTPQFAAGAAAGTCSFTPRPARLELISKYVRPGDYPEPQKRTQPSAFGELPIVIQVTDPIAELAEKGEQEHCDDIKLAFDRTIKPCSEALARLAGTTLTGNNGEECLADLSQKLGFDPRNCSREFNRLYQSTQLRDDRKWHAFDRYLHTVDRSQAVYRYRRGKNNKIEEKVKPEAVVPEAAGCSGAAAAPASPPAPPQPPQGGGPVQVRGEALAPEESGEPSPQTNEEPAVSPEEEASPAPEQAPAAAVIVEDDATEIGEGQMTKSEFLARLRPALLTAAEAGLTDKDRAGQAGSFLDLWLGDYETKDAGQINRDLPGLVAGERRPATAEGYIAAIAARMRTGIATWERTGELPPGLPSPGMGGLLGGVFFKALPGGPRDPGSPQALRAELGAGRPLDGGVCSRMESAFGRSFSQVRVHADGRSAGLSHRLNARAFTVGEHVAFGARQYQPGTVLGDALLAHELAHVAQQSEAPEAVQPMRADTASDGALERDADRAAVGAVASLWGLRLPGLRRPLQAAPRLSSGLRLQRCGNCNGERAGAPVVKSFDAVKRSEPQMSIWYQKCRLALGLEAGPPGMSFAPEGELPEDGAPGELQFLQLIDSCREKRATSGFSMRRKTSGYVLDHEDPYPPPIPGSGKMAPGSRIDVFTNDNPGLDTPGFDRLSIDDKFKMWLLWKPDEPPGAPRVPLWMVEWSWKAKATRTGTGGDCTDDWKVSGAEALGGTGAPTDAMPAWSQNAKNIPWEPGTCT